ncbi:hypothetical protein INS49_012990 [Diaporthe citri]|uniref:uncharacterized protein n=1 Tax=Diaporthe citri TaxID=83186 RepID=UPI001C7F4ACC|nr:uncharacterized protein INS49_012990 [Diaporthe citri]KAG6359469.1 hypothetical protein INS49_012990 [Diaporthe citri]
MASENHPFYSIWASESIRERLFANLSKSDICSVRLANSACCNLVTRRLFQRVHLSFNPNSFTKQSRIQALGRIGHHVEHIIFYLPHSDATFLPPLIHPQTGSEISYLYTPHTSMTSTLTRPKYGNSELGDILTQQYPPLFHASTNVPSFIHAMKNLPNMRHLTIKTPGQDARERYRRDIVDYALISLRIAIERTPQLTKLNKLSLSGAALALVASPRGAKRWRQIRKLHVSVEAWDFYGPSGPGLDQLKIIDDYLRNFSDCVEKLSFTWTGAKGPCPLALAEDALFDPPRECKKLFNEVTSPMSPLPATPGVRQPMRFTRLKHMQVRNASMSEAQLRRLVEGHKATVKEFDFENVVLLNGGNWDEALAPLMAPSEKSGRARAIPGRDTRPVESVRTVGPRTPRTPRSPRTPRTPKSSVAQDDDVAVRHPSAAVEAVGRDLLDEIEDEMEAFVGLSRNPSKADVCYFDNKEEIIVELDEDLSEELSLQRTLTASDEPHRPVTATASQASLDTVGAEEAFSGKLKKKRVRRRIRKPWHPKREDGEQSEDEEGQDYYPPRSNEELKEKHSLASFLHHKRSGSSSHSSKNRNVLRRARQSSDPGPYSSCQIMDPNTYEIQLPEVLGSDDETLTLKSSNASQSQTTLKSSNASMSQTTLKSSNASQSQIRLVRAPSHPLPPVPLNISAPMPAEQLPVLLQPAVYNPQASTTSIPMPPGSRGSGDSSNSISAPLMHANGQGHNVNDGLSAVQRNLEQEEMQLRFAEDAEARANALQKARDAVLRKLGKLNAANAMNKIDEGPRLEQHPALVRTNSGGTMREQPPAGPPDNGSKTHLRIRELLGAGTRQNSAETYKTIESSSSLLVPLVFSGN